MKTELVPATVLPTQVDDDGRHFTQLSGATVHFTMTTHTGGPLDLKQSVRRLLAADLAAADAWLSEPDVRVTPSLRRLALSLRIAERLKGNLRTLQNETTFRSLSPLVLRHPILVGRKLVRRRLGTVGEVNSEAGFSSLDEVLEFGAVVVGGAQKIAVVEPKLDAGQSGGQSHGEDEFVRLTLRGSYRDIRLPGTDETFFVVYETRLIIHPSRVLQIIIFMPVYREMPTPPLAQLLRSDCAVTVKSQLAEPLLKSLPARQLRGRWLDELDAGARLREKVFDEKVAMAELLERYFFVVGEAIGKRLPLEGNTYATPFAPSVQCCGAAQRSTEHQKERARIASRYNNGERIYHDKLTGKNYSLNPESILVSNLASTTRNQTRGGPPAPIVHLKTALLIAQVPLQFFRTRSLEETVSSPNLFGMRLQSVQQEAVAVLSAMHQHKIRYGLGRELATQQLADIRGDGIRYTIETALGLTAQANAMCDASVQARHSLGLKWLGDRPCGSSSRSDALGVARPGKSEFRRFEPRRSAHFSDIGGGLRGLGTLDRRGCATVDAVGLFLLKRLWVLFLAAWCGARHAGGLGQPVVREFALDVAVQECSSLP